MEQPDTAASPVSATRLIETGCAAGVDRPGDPHRAGLRQYVRRAPVRDRQRHRRYLVSRGVAGVPRPLLYPNYHLHQPGCDHRRCPEGHRFRDPGVPGRRLGVEIENRTHYVRDVTFREDASQIRTGNLPRALAAIRNLIIGTCRLAGHANTAAARRYYGRDDSRTLALYGFRQIGTG